MKKLALLIGLSIFSLLAKATYPQTLPIDYNSFFAATAINANGTDLVRDIYANTTLPILPNEWAALLQTSFLSPALVNSTLNYSTYADNNAGKAIVSSPNRFYGCYSLTSGNEYTGKAFYFSTLINFSAIRNADAFIFFSRDYYGNYSRGHLMAQTSGTGFQLGVQFNTETAVYGTTVLNYNQTYLVVLKIVPVTTGTESLSVFVNPLISNIEPTIPEASTSITTAALTKIGGLTLRATPTGKFSGLRFSDKWTDAVGIKLPNLTAPVVAAPTAITYTGFTANWTPSANAVSYDVIIYQGMNLVKTTNLVGQAISSYVYSGASIGYTYTYKVVAKGDNINFIDSDLSSTSTQVSTTVGNQIILPKVINSNMVLQQDMLVSLWGWGAVNDNVVITASWGATVNATVGVDGKWTTKIQTPKAVSGQAPQYSLTFKGRNNTIALNNILVGDVWVCSGQSNMAMSVTSAFNSSVEIAAANYPNIRILNIGTNAVQTVQNNSISGTWNLCSPSTIGSFSAIAYYFGRELATDPTINIPIGLLVAAWGSSTCEAWTKNETLAADPQLKSIYLDPFVASPSSISLDQLKPSWLYNGMLAPIIPYGIKGALWYQGEANAGKPDTYTKLCGTMIQDWRTLWGLGDFPFYYVQLPAYNNTYWPALREAQTNVLTIKNTGMAVTLDVGELTNIHPLDKQTPSKRLALWAKAKTYGQNIVYAGPIYKSSSSQDGKMVINFLPETIGGGLISKDGAALTNFQIAGADNVLYAADAIISGNTVIVSSTSVANPTKVWFAYSSTAQPNLTNLEGLPTCPFRTDTWNNSVVLGTEEIPVYSTKSSNTLKVQGKTIIAYETGAIQVYNLLGKRLLDAKVVNQLNTNLANGIYVVRFTNKSGKSISEKLIIAEK